MSRSHWESKTVGELVSFSGGSQPPRSTFENTPRDGYVRLIQIRDYKSSDYETYIPRNLAKKFCRKDDVMIGRYGPPIFQILRGLEGAYNVALIKAIPNGEVTKSYLYYFLQQRPIFLMIDRLSRRSAGQAGVDLDALREYEFPLPALAEQGKISELLNWASDSVDNFSKLIDFVRERKRGLMQQLVTGQTRFKEFVKSSKKVKSRYGDFPEDWSQVHMGDIADEAGKKNGGGRELPVLSCTKYHGLVNSLEYFGKRIFSEDTSTYRIVERGDFAYATNHIEEGSIGYQNLHDAALISPMYTVFRTKPGVDHEFFWKLIKTELYRHIFEVNTSGSIARRGALRWDEFALIKVFLPTVPEQKRIAAVLNTCDEEIKLLEKQLEALKEQKRGLMQKLLTGEVRVKL